MKIGNWKLIFYFNFKNMDILKLNLQNPQEEIINETINVLTRGGCVIYPTDTVYGLGVNAFRVDAIERLFKIKKRPASKSIPIIVKDIEMLKKTAYFDRKTEKLLGSIFPGAVTIILQKRNIIPEILTGGKTTIGARIPACEFISLLMARLDFPITSTSANISGQNPSGDIKEVLSQFKGNPKPDLVLDAGNLPRSEPSTVLDLTSPKPKVTRIGPVSKNQLLEMLKI